MTRGFDKPDAVFASDCVYGETDGRIYENRNRIHRRIDDAIERRIVLTWKITNSLTPVEEKDGLPSPYFGHAWLTMLV
ncbi:hypothetical protein FHX77_000373 [Bifidobacterium commune]|uniref:Uncharacterized protein n=1 Tax=Bifidobacterium commune TaxID=1505727 RepID=A0A1C4H3K4_9BIFI|nr:hypothetical protein [Bifidobacterium commune]MBB2954993.1 hypothetical protein [Bifidobacterium commune]SCC79208.1 hypothetical protein GA0061077_0625 [Bifidobacterium commune]